MKEQYEKLGAFYLGRRYDLASRTLSKDVILYDSKDLTTHAIIIGMTGSGKTGLGIGLLEEALIDGIPIIAIDPKGDLPNLLLTFPDLRPADFIPWINPQDAASHGMRPEQYAALQARWWRDGLAQWDQDPERIARLREAAEFAVYTPGSNAGRPVSVLRNFAAPPLALLQDLDLRRERIETTVTSLLALLGMEVDPITSREHILLANIFESAWMEGRGLDLASLIQAIQTPPFQRIGVMDLEFFFPAKERFGLAMRLNNLLAAPGFEAWMEGEPLDMERLLYTPQGKPRAAIFSISHLSEGQRMFFVATLLNELLGWVRTQPGTASLRAVLYMDEIFGFFPPVSNPPSKAPLLTLLKQARAYGLGVVLSTQNPVDLDYKGLSNTGTWFIGRLQTERDKERVMAGLEGAAAGAGYDHRQMEKVLAGLEKRTFLLRNVHENEPVLFQTRWALSYLAGPMTREQIKTLVQDPLAVAPKGYQGGVTAGSLGQVPEAGVASAAPLPPSLPPEIDVLYLAASGVGKELVYYPAVTGLLDIHYYDARRRIDTTRTTALAAELGEGPVPLDWDNAMAFHPPALRSEPLPGVRYRELPASAKQGSNYRKWSTDLVHWIRQNHPLVLYRATDFNMTSEPEESEGAFRARIGQQVREMRDREAEKLRQKYSSRFTTLRDRLMRAEQAVEKEQEQSKATGVQTVISFGTALLGAFLGRKVVSAGSATRMGTAMKTASRMKKEKMDVGRAQERAESIREQLASLEDQLQKDIDRLNVTSDPQALVLEEIHIRPKSSDITLKTFGLRWLPFRQNAGGERIPDWN
jgi:hypothetical protein